MPSESAPPASGAKKPVRIGKYDVLEHIANGGMGAVYRARDPEAQTDVALKILLPELAAKQAMVVRFRREYAAASKLRHENIVALYDLGEASNTLYFAMELVEGIDLHEHIQKKGTLDPEEARQIVLQAARALRHANAHGIVHRDIKPSNFLLARKGGRQVVKLTDFGLAREASGEEFRVTRAGTTVGTIDYMSPEQARDSSAADIRSDLYSLGSTWYHLLVGHAPFAEGGLGERLIKIMNDIPVDARDLNPTVSDETWAILEKLLAKAPEDRYQTPEELIDDLLPLEGKATARPKAKPKSKPAIKKKKRGRPSGETEAGQATRADSPAGNGTYIALGIAAAVMLAAACLFLFLPRRAKPSEGQNLPEPPSVVRPGDKDKPPTDGSRKDKGPDKSAIVQAKLPALYPLPGKEFVDSLRQEVEKPWAASPAAGTGKVVKVRRVATAPDEVRTLAEAAAQLPADGSGSIEIHDNGPLFEVPLAVAGKSLTIRAGKGYRPLLVWDLAATQTKRRAEGKLGDPLAFLSCKGGTLSLEGIETVWQWPDALGESAAVLAVEGGGLRVSGCAFSGAGRPREVVFLARVKSAKEGTPVRLDRCQVRGQGLAGLDLDAPGAEVLIDGCLLTGHGPMVRVRAKASPPTRLRFVRSTLTAREAMVDLLPEPKGEERPGLSVLVWDSLLSRSGGTGDLLRIRDGSGPASVEWKPINALYAGWGSLLASAPKRIAGLEEWRKQWLQLQGDRLVRDAWPDAPTDEPSARPASEFLPAKAMAFGATVDPDRPLGCDLNALPSSRNNWLAVAFHAGAAPPEPITDASPPDIPNPGDSLFHGATFDISEGDLGAFLAARKLGPRVVMYLTGKGAGRTSPIRVKGSTLVLHFPPPDDARRLALVARVTDSAPLVSVEDGGLEIINGLLQTPDSAGVRLPYVVRVRGGDLQMFRTRIEGPRFAVPDGYQGAVLFSGSGEAENPRTATLNECVLLSSQGGLRVADPGARVLLRQCLLVAGSEALSLQPGSRCKGRAGVQVTMQNCTVAGKRAAVQLGGLAEGDPPALPVQVHTVECAFLNPFPGKASRGGLLLYEGESLPRGLLTWKSERDGYDSRLWFGAWPLEVVQPEAREPKEAWARVLGSPGMPSPRAALTSLKLLDAKSWDLERLLVPVRDLGADLQRLGIRKK